MPRSVDTDIQVQPDGTVLSSEIDIAVATTTGTVANKVNSVNWIDAANNLIAQIQGVVQNTVYTINTYVQDLLTNFADLQLGVDGINLVSYAKIILKNGTKNTSALILDTNGASSFLQLVAAQAGPIMVDYGTATVTFAANQSASVIVPHNLGRIPLIMMATPNTTVQAMYVGAGSRTTTQFQLNAFSTVVGGITGTFTIFWMAIG